MSRTRQKHNEIDLYLFPMKTTETDYQIENSDSTVGIHFRAEDMGMKTRSEINILGGHSYQGTTVNVYKTMNQMDFNIGDVISTVPNPTAKDKSAIVKISSKPQNKRGARHNTTRVIEYTIEVS